LGNHELWGKNANVSSRELLNDIFPTLGNEYGFTYLEHTNLIVKDTTFVGTYGHFDYSFLKQESSVTITDLLRGSLNINGRQIFWKDRFFMDWEGRTDQSVCAELVGGFEQRLKAVRNTISISHTIPSLGLHGWPESPEQLFYQPYSGSRLIGDAIERSGESHHFCGHTHAKAKAQMGKTQVINVGSDYNVLRYVIISSGEIQERQVSFLDQYLS